MQKDWRSTYIKKRLSEYSVKLSNTITPSFLNANKALEEAKAKLSIIENNEKQKQEELDAMGMKALGVVGKLCAH